MCKYPISLEFFPFSCFAPSIDEKFLNVAVPNMKVPKKFLKVKDVLVSKQSATGHDGALIDYFVITPQNLKSKAPCLFYIHGGGFVMKAAAYHYMNCVRYAKEAGCIVIFPDYRLAPKYPFPIFYEDCYSVFCKIYDDADALGIDKEHIGVGGDSAGSDLAVGLCMMAHERNHPVRFLFQMLPYPFLDARNNSESCKKFTDTPMWNSKLSDCIAPMTKVCKDNPVYLWYSPVEGEDFSFFPPTYIETAEFDCLHDDGILFAKKLEEAGVDVCLNETRKTMHGYDIMTKSSVAKASMIKRIDFMTRYFEK